MITGLKIKSYFFRDLKLSLVLFMVIPFMVQGQLVLKVGDYTGCINEFSNLPLSVKNMNDIAAFTIYINIDTNFVEVASVENVNDVLSGSNLILGSYSDGIILTWFSTSAVTINDDVICDLKVKLKNDSANFIFKNDCEFVYSDLSLVENVEYINGRLINLNLYDINIKNPTVLEGDDIKIVLNFYSEGLTYKWQKLSENLWVDIKNDEIFSGVNTKELFIKNIGFDLDGTKYRCVVSNGFCYSTTSECIILVNPNGILLEDSSEYFKVYPNPAVEFVYCLINNRIDGKILLRDMKGYVLREVNLSNKNSHKILKFDLSNLKKGVYLLQLNKGGLNISTKKLLKG
jgi:hypothetical protein